MNGESTPSASDPQLRPDAEYRRLFLSNPTAMWIFDIATLQFLEVNDAAVAQYGYSRDEFLGMTIRDIRPQTTSDQTALDQRLAALTPLTRASAHRHRRADGTVIDVDIVSHEIGWNGREARFVMSTDVSERVRAQADRSRLAAIVQSSVNAIVSITAGVITSWNPAAEAMFGFTADEATGQPADVIVPDTAREEAAAINAQVLAGSTVRERESVRVRRDGTRFPAALSVFRVSSSAELSPTISTIIRDLSEQRELEAQLRQSQRMEAMGRLAGAVAHDFNNLLTVIKIGAELAIDTIDSHAEARRDLEEIIRATERAAVLTRQLLAFGRTHAAQVGPIRLQHVLGETEGMLGRVVGSDIVMQIIAPSDIPPVLGDAGQLEQILLNLALNAGDAMPEGGSLTMTLDPLAAASLPAHLRLANPGNGVLLTVADTGVGMDADAMSRCFEPFFTTKDDGRGSGLGLATVYGCVRQWGGAVWVESELGTGTRIHLWFKATDLTADPAPVFDAAHPALAAVEGAVLLVEDAAPIRALAERLLTAQGFTVLAAADGESALEVWERHRASIVAVVTDVRMPRLGGRELVARIRAVDPSLPVVYVSGFVDGGDLPATDLATATVFLEKPFTRDGLLGALAMLLEPPTR